MSEPVIDTPIAPVAPNFFDDNGPTPSFAESMRQRAASGPVASIEEPEVSAERDEQGRFKAKVSDVTAESSTADAPKVEVTTEPKAETVPESVTGENETQEQNEEPVQGKEASKRIRELLAKVKELEAKAQTGVKVDSPTTTTSDVKAEPSTAKPKLQRPDINTFAGTLEEFSKALQDWDDHRQVELRQEIAQQISMANLQRDIVETEKRLPGFQKACELVGGALGAKPECAAVAQILGEGEAWKDITHYLGSNPSELDNLVQLTKTNQLDAVVEAVHIRDKVLAKKSAAPETPKPKTTSTPPPPSPVQARATGSSFSENDEGGTADEWARKRNEQVSKRRR